MTSVNWIAVLGAGIAGWFWGWAYFTVLGKAWMRAQGINPEDCKGKKMPVAPMLLALIGSLLMAALLGCLRLDLGIETMGESIALAAAIGIAFIGSSVVVNNAFQNKKPMLSVIDSIHWIGLLVIQGVILALFP